MTEQPLPVPLESLEPLLRRVDALAREAGWDGSGANPLLQLRELPATMDATAADASPYLLARDVQRLQAELQQLRGELAACQQALRELREQLMPPASE